MTNQDYENLLREAYDEVLNRKNFGASNKFFSPDVIMHDGRDTIKGLEEAKKLIEERNKAVPDFHVKIDDIIVDGEKAVVRWNCSGKASKDFADFKAGKPINYRGMTMFEIKDNRIVRLWQYGDAVDI